MIDFLLRKFLATLLLPLPMTLLWCMVGVILLFFQPCVVAGKYFIVAGLCNLFVFSTPFIPEKMLRGLESQYQPLDYTGYSVPGIRHIIVLGAGNGGNAKYRHYPPNSTLSAASLSRLVEGIRLYRLIPHSQLILSGGRVFGSLPDSEVMNNVAVILGVAPQDIVMESGSQDTHQEAIRIKKIVGTQPFILVTSAYHLPRAMLLFKRCGLHPIPAPTQFLLGAKRHTMQSYFPNSMYLLYSDIAIHEYVGIIWAKLNGEIK